MRLRPTIVVLAAGRGSRFLGATPKLEQPLGDSTVLGCTLARAIETGCPVVAVTVAPLVPLCGTLLAKRDVIVLSDAEARRGVGHTIACGVAERPGSAGWLVQPGDMPMVRPSSSLAVAAALAEHPVACTQYHGRRGHPVGFSSELYSELIALDGDDGARRLVARYPAHGAEVDDPGVLVDIDTLEDLAALRGSNFVLRAG